MTAVSIVFPVYNERESIRPVLREWIHQLKKMKMRYELVICEDGSTDGTSQLVQKMQKPFHLTLDQSARRRGYGGAVLSGIGTATYPLVLCVDSDGQCDPKDLPKFLKKFHTGQVLIGWRTTRRDAPQRLIFSMAFKTVFRLLFPNVLHDPSAPYVLFEKRTIAPIIPLLGYLREGFWWGFVAACIKKGITITELPMVHRKRFVGETQVYLLKKMPSIVWRNLRGLFALRFA